MVVSGLKKIDYKSNRMSFITRLNLVLVWAKIVQMLTKKSSQWVRHNQVSWSSSSEKWVVNFGRVIAILALTYQLGQIINFLS